MIHDLDIVQWLVGSDVELTDVRAVGIPVLTNRVDAANARLEFASGAVANITASRVGTEKIRKMRFFQPNDYIAVDYVTSFASISTLAPPSATGSWPSVQIQHLDVADVEPLRAEIESFLQAINEGRPAPVTGLDGRRALALALRLIERIHEHSALAGINTRG
jgi:predicted dehydrogenase